MFSFIAAPNYKILHNTMQLSYYYGLLNTNNMSTMSGNLLLLLSIMQRASSMPQVLSSPLIDSLRYFLPNRLFHDGLTDKDRGLRNGTEIINK